MIVPEATSAGEDTVATQGIQAKSVTGIPEAEFIASVDDFMKRPGNGTAAEVIKRLDELHGKYKYMEASLMTKKIRLNNQVPDIEKSLNLVELLTEKDKNGEECNAQFMLADQCYMRATIPPSKSVCLWLGANVMLEYSLPEAAEILTSNLRNAKRNLNQIETDLDFLKDQLTTTEVNMARVYNWDVQQRKLRQQS